MCKIKHNIWFLRRLINHPYTFQTSLYHVNINYTGLKASLPFQHPLDVPVRRDIHAGACDILEMAKKHL